MSNIIPPALIRRLGNSAGFDTAAFEAVHEQEGGFTAIRVNPTKWKAPAGVTTDPVPWCDTGFYLTERPVFTLDPLFHAGCYYRSEEHTSELQSLMRISYAVFCLKKKKEIN